MPRVRVRSPRGPWLVVVLAVGFSLAHAARPLGAVPWHLGSHCRACLGVDEAWERYGTGHADIAVVVAEKDIYADTRSAESWHPGLGPRFEVVLGSHAPVLVDPHPYVLLTDLVANQARGNVVFDRYADKPGRPTLAAPTESPEMCSFVSGGASAIPRNHDLQMASLIGGQSYLGTSGVAPGTHVILTQASLIHGGLDLLADLVARRPEVRVVNFSQGPGRLHDESSRRRTPPHSMHYHRLNRLVMELSIAGMLATRAKSATRFLVVAAAGNVPAFETELFEPNEVLDPRIPFQAIHFGRHRPHYTDLRPHYLHDVPHPELPLLVVGALGPSGMLPSYGRIDQGIDLYAPAGLDWLAHIRAPPTPAPMRRLSGAQWRDCVCARLAQDHSSFARRTDYVAPPCWPDDQDSAWSQLGVPALDFHIHAFRHDEPFTPLRTHCAEPPNSLCTSLAAGTSAAAALVSGVAALMFALDPTQSGEEAAAILKSTARVDNPLRLPVVDPAGALDAVVQRIGARLVRAFADAPSLAPSLGTPFYYAWLNEPEPFVFTDSKRAARFVAESFTWLDPRNRWRIERLRNARVLRCGVGLAGSTVGIRELLNAPDACTTSSDEVEILRVEFDLSDGRRDLDLRVVLRRAGRLDPQTEWRVAGLSVTEEPTTWVSPVPVEPR